MGWRVECVVDMGSGREDERWRGDEWCDGDCVVGLGG